MALQISATNPEHPALLLDLPWQLPLEEWPEEYLVPLPRGISRHVVRYARAGTEVVAVKELAERPALREYELLRTLDRLGIPAVDPLAVVTGRADAPASPLEPVLITRHLAGSMPYRSMFETTCGPRTVHRLMDALAVLLVRLHLAGFAWGDCSLSNTLFRRDAGAYAAYLVDAETGEVHPQLTSTGQREYDIDLARVNISGELLDLEAAGCAAPLGGPDRVRRREICARYTRAVDELTRDVGLPGGQAPLHRPADPAAERPRLRRRRDADRALLERRHGHRSCRRSSTPGHHQRQLLRLTGLDTEENQARRLLNDLESWMATQEDYAPGDPLGARPEVLAHRWVRDVFRPTVRAVPQELRGPWTRPSSTTGCWNTAGTCRARAARHRPGRRRSRTTSRTSCPRYAGRAAAADGRHRTPRSEAARLRPAAPPPPGRARGAWTPWATEPIRAPTAERCARRPTTISWAPAGHREQHLARTAHLDVLGHRHVGEPLQPRLQRFRERLLLVRFQSACLVERASASRGCR